MKMGMKKWAAGLLAVLLLLTATACGGDEDVRGTIQGGESVGDKSDSDATTTTASADKEAVTTTVSSDEETTTTTTSAGNGGATTTASSDKGTATTATSAGKGTTTTAAKDDEYKFGSTVGGKYENTYIGIGCTLGSDWTYKSDAEILKQNNMVKDVVDEETEKLLAQADVLYDMMAVHSNGMDSINVNLTKASTLQLMTLDVKQSLEQSQAQIKTGLGSMGYTDFKFSVIDVEIDGQKFDGMRTTAVIQGITMYQLTVAIKCNKHLAMMTIATFGTDGTGALLDSVYLVD